MEPLIPITGYAESYEALCTKIAEPGEFYNVLDEKPFTTYCKQEGVEIGETTETTDVIGWYKNKAELESNVRFVEGDVYIVGEYSPYTRLKGMYVDHIAQWVEDGEESKKIVKKYKNKDMLMRAHNVPEENVYYAVGKELPFKLYGVVSSWDKVGSFISWLVDDINQLLHKDTKSNPGEIAYMEGLYYLFTNNRTWEKIDIPEPMKNVFEHSYVDKTGNKYKLREGQYPGTVEYYQPRY